MSRKFETNLFQTRYSTGATKLFNHEKIDPFHLSNAGYYTCIFSGNPDGAKSKKSRAGKTPWAKNHLGASIQSANLTGT